MYNMKKNPSSKILKIIIRVSVLGGGGDIITNI